MSENPTPKSRNEIVGTIEFDGTTYNIEIHQMVSETLASPKTCSVRFEHDGQPWIHSIYCNINSPDSDAQLIARMRQEFPETIMKIRCDE